MLPEETKILEKKSGIYTANMHRGLPSEIADIVFCAPTSFRDPERDNIWHPYLLKQGKMAFFIGQMVPLLKSFGAGLWRWLVCEFGSTVLIERPDSQVVAVGPDAVCHLNGDINTEYLIEKDVSNVHWLISQNGRHGSVFSRTTIIVNLFKMMVVWFKVVKSGGRSKYDFVCSLLFLRWLLSLVWVKYIGIYRDLEAAFIKLDPKLVFCVHEMHPLSRLVWCDAHKNNITTITVQHATITREKLWYFITDEEKDVGLRYPDIFSVYSRETKKLLQQNGSENTQFELSCGPRFQKWKKFIQLYDYSGSGGTDILMVGSLAWWDNEMIFRLLDAMLQNNMPYKISLRLHPSADFPENRKNWLDKMVNSNRISYSHGELMEELRGAELVIGGYSSVLHEAALLGRAVLMVDDLDFLYGREFEQTVKVDNVFVKIEACMSSSSINYSVVKKAKDLFGLNKRVFTLADR